MKSHYHRLEAPFVGGCHRLRRIHILFCGQRRLALSRRNPFILAVIGVSLLVAGLYGQAQDTSTQAPLTLTLQDALAYARSNSVVFQSTLTDLGVAHQDITQTRAALLPSVSYITTYLYTQGGTGTVVPRYIANNAVHEYVSQGDVHQVLGYSQVSDFRRSRALESVARAKAEIAARGLVVTVVQNFYGLIASQRKY